MAALLFADRRWFGIAVLIRLDPPEWSRMKNAARLPRAARHG
jgi:hypothetical protein